MTRRLLTCFVALFLGGMPMASLAQNDPTITRIDIARMPAGQSPLGFDFARTGSGALGIWRVVEDLPGSGGKIIAQLSDDRTDYRFPLAVYQPVVARDVEVSLRFKSVAGRVDQAGGIAVRLTGPNDYYLVRANALENNVRFYRVQNGSRRQLDGVSAKVAPGQWHTLGVRAEGALFTVTFDGLQLFIAEDNGYADIGRVALWTKADSVTFFDAIKIEALR